MQNSRLTTKLRFALGLQSLAFVYAFLLAGSLGAQSVYIPYTFTTLAGQASIGSADGTGSAARFYNPHGVATDSSGNVYVADTDNSTIRKITPAGVVATLAGLAEITGSADGTGSAARFSHPAGVATDSSGNVYVADTDNSTIRKITPAGVVTTLAGLAGITGSADGTGSAARFYGPRGVATDSSGNVYVADTDNSTIRKITPAGVVTTLAGLAEITGSADGTGSAARFYGPSGVATDSSGNVYVGDTGNRTIRQITPARVVTTLAGLAGNRGSDDGTGSAARFGAPFGVATDSSGNVYVADNVNYTIRQITPAGVVTTLAGHAGNPGSADGTGSEARFWGPIGVATDSSGNVYVADYPNNTIRQITPAGVVTTLAGLAENRGIDDGTGSAARFYYPQGVATDSSGNVYVADGDSTIRQITPAGVVTTLAGLAGGYGSDDGTGSEARFYGPQGVATDSSGNVYVADYGNHTIRQITPAGVVTTLAGLAGITGSEDGTGSAARFNNPAGVATDSSGNVYVGDTGNKTIRQITPAGVVTTLAGLAGITGSDDGTGSAARFYYPQGVATDSSGNVYVADYFNNTIRQITPAGMVTTLAGLAENRGIDDGTGSAARFYYPQGVATDSSGNVYVADGDSTIRQITPAGVVTTLAGLAGGYGSDDGTGSEARFYGPQGVATDSSGNVYVADTFNNTIRQITPAGVVTTLAGLAGITGSEDGTGSAARFNNPAGVATDSSGNVYVGDTGNKTIRQITPAGVVTTLAGLAGITGSDDGTGSAARFYYPQGVATDSSGNVYVADGDSTIRQITPAGVVTTLAGLAGINGSADGTGSAARFSGPQGVATDSSGNVYVADTGNSTIRKITPAGVVTTLAGLAEIRGSDDGTGSAARFYLPDGVATDSSGNVYVADTYNSTIRKGFLPPQLTILLSGVPPSGIVLTWPTNAAGFILQCTTNLVSPAFWSTYSPAPVVIAGQNTVTNPITGAQQFFRLIQ